MCLRYHIDEALDDERQHLCYLGVGRLFVFRILFLITENFIFDHGKFAVLQTANFPVLPHCVGSSGVL